MASFISRRIRAFLLSGPDALCTFKLERSLFIPAGVIVKLGIFGWGLGPLSGISPGGSWVNADLNCRFNIFALPLASETRVPCSLREETPELSRLKLLIKDQKRFWLGEGSSVDGGVIISSMYFQ